MKFSSSWRRAKKLHVKVKPLKLQGLYMNDDDEGEIKVKLKMKWRGPTSSSSVLVSFYQNSTCLRNYTGERLLKKNEPILWGDDEFENNCSFRYDTSVVDNSFCPWDLSFHVLYAKSTDSPESKVKFAEVGKVWLDLAGLASFMESQIEKEIPVTLCIDGIINEVHLLARISFIEHRTCIDSACKSVKYGYFRNQQKKKEKNDDEGQSQTTSSESEQSAVSDSDRFPIENSSIEVASSRYRNMRLATGLLAWKSRRLGFRPARNKCEPLSEWEIKEVDSRDRQARLKGSIFFASFDQQSKKASGHSACAPLAAVIAHWLYSNRDLSVPTRGEFNSLITKGSYEWQILCRNETYKKYFPDKHFDLETVLEAGIRPLTILKERSFTGVFSSQKISPLKEAMSFDEIWNQITRKNNGDNKPNIYIVSWNDHFFVLKIDFEAYYIIDTLGERLFEGCNKAYILKFDDSTLLEVKKPSSDKEEGENTTYRGKECCREFLKRFFAAIPIKELAEEEKKGTVSTFALLKRLQIDFHYCHSFGSSSSFTDSFTSSPSSTVKSSSLQMAECSDQKLLTLAYSFKRFGTLLNIGLPKSLS